MIRLSPSTIGLYKDCPKCFWLEKKKGIKRPRGIFPSLPSGMDRILKTRYDENRARGGLPLEIPGYVTGKLYSEQAKLDAWRNWRTGMSADIDGVTLIGAIDDLIVNLDNTYSPFDFKTKGSATTQEDAERYYQHQLDMYAVLIEANLGPTNGKAYLAYYYPKSFNGDFRGLANENVYPEYICQLVTVETDVGRGKKLLLEAATCLDMASPPSSNEGCEYCSFVEARKGENR